MQSLGGSVLAEQTVLGFTGEPPSPHCTPVLPACVSEGRGGEPRFAMNHKTQLQFNLGVHPDQANLATRFDPTRTSPVVIEKMQEPSETIGMSRTPVGDFNAVSSRKLALALKLAKRNAPLCSVECSPEIEITPPVLNEKRSVADIRTRCELPHKSDVATQTKEKSQHEKAPTKAPGISPSPSVFSISREISQLKADLKKTLVKLNKVTEAQEHLKSPRVANITDRVYWEQHLDDHEERLQQRREEQLARNARMLYDLSQQVKDLQKQFDRPNRQGVVKPALVRKLAAAQRAALRTLQNCSTHTRWGLPVPPELSLLIQQLAVLSNKLEEGGEDRDLDTTLQQLMATLDNKEKLDRSIQIQNDFTPKKKYIWSKEAIARSKTKKRTGGVLYSTPRPHRHATHYHDHGHFSRQTFNSSRRQQPIQPYTPPRADYQPPLSSTPAKPSSPNKRGSPNLVPAASQRKLKKKDIKKIKPFGRKPVTTRSPEWKGEKAVRKTPSPDLKRKKQPSSSPDLNAKKRLLPQDSDNMSSLSPPPSEDILPGPSVDVQTAIASQARELQALRREISERLIEMRTGSRPRPDPLAVRDELLSDLDTEELESPLPALSPRLGNMIQRLEELEAEEETIRQRWHTIAYEDPLITKPSLAINKSCSRPPVSWENNDSATTARKVVKKQSSRQVVKRETTYTSVRQEASQATSRTAVGEESARPLTSAQATRPQAEAGRPHMAGETSAQTARSPVVRETALPVLSSKSMSQIDEYREQYSHYLTSTGHSRQGGVDSWKIAENIADDLVDELLEGVAGEVRQVCDGCVEELFGNEFIRPP